MCKKRRRGTYLPITARHTVSGVDRNKPIGPHSQLQNTAATITANDDTPVLEPYSQGSTRLLLINSSVTNNPIVHAAMAQPGSTAIANPIGIIHAITGPTYGINRSNIA